MSLSTTVRRQEAAGEGGLPRLLPADRGAVTDLRGHRLEFGPVRYRGDELIEQAAVAGLTGRGGAAFPVATKLSAVASRGPGTVVVGNAAEGEPASSKDAALLWYSPHLVLDGLQAAADAVGARTAYLYLGCPQLAGHLDGGPDRRARGRCTGEAALGTPLDRLLPLGDDVQAVLAGGYHGGWLTTGAARQLTLSGTALRSAGASLGAGVLVAPPADACGLAETAAVAQYLAAESAGQCGPCWNGLPAIATALTEVARPRPAPQALADLSRWTSLVTGRGACHHPDGSARFVTTALSVFAAEIAAHATGRCTATRRRRFLPVAGGADA